MRIGVVGVGVVGNAMVKLCEHHNTPCYAYDVDPSRSTHKLSEALAADIIFICLPTPRHFSGAFGLSTLAVDNFLLSVANSERRLVLRSTVPIGYTKQAAKMYRLPNLVHSPEFLTARTAASDAIHPTRNIIGYPYGSSKDWLAQLYRHWFTCPLLRMDSNESEAVKLFQNSFSAVKIALFNEFYQLAAKLQLDWEVVRQGLLAGGWINPMHTQVPGPDGRFGFGGTCLPKDLSQVLAHIYHLDLSAKVCRAAIERNKEDRS